MHYKNNIFSTITFVCLVVCLSIAPSFAQNQPKVPPRCLQRYFNCVDAYKDSGIASKDSGIRAQCKNQYDSCLKGVTIR